MGLTGPLKWHGGKTYLARRIIDLMPRHKTYVEPYCGGAAVLLAKPPTWRAAELSGSERGVSETINDLNGWLTGFWRVLQDPDLFEQFRRRMEATPISEVEWREARQRSDQPIESAVRLMVLYRQSRGGDPGKGFQSPSRRPRREMNEHASAWQGAIDGLLELHKRLRRVAVLNRPAADVIRQLDGPSTLFYLDPPYLHDTRTTTCEYGSFEMTGDDHRELLTMLRQVSGKVILSGYRSDLYDRELAGWNRHEFEMPNQAAGGRSKRRMLECLWCNFRAGEEFAETASRCIAETLY